MPRQTTQKLITALYPRLSHEDTFQGESNSISNQKRILEAYAKQNGVRFIAINDGVDSAQGDNDFAPLRNIFNEWLVRDTSKKIRAVKRSKGMSGKPVTSKPVYGYLMDEDENFIIDKEAALVVKQIYSLCLAGNGPTKIARVLTEQQTPTPGTPEYRRTGSTCRYHPGYECRWATNTVARRTAANAEKFMKVVRKYTSFEELTPTLLREFVEKIVIHESEALDGKRRGSSADRKSKSIILLSARWNCPTKARPVRQSVGQGTAKFFTLLLLLYLT